MEWDTAAGEAILCAAGGVVLDTKGSLLVYGKAEKSYRNDPFVAWRNPSIIQKATFS
jgi:3'-phosphoadenosine 5'-phosphosulfate (PAPS) 3'-phosphatase